MKKKYNGVVISDVHVGAIPIEKLYQEYKYQFIDRIKKMKDLDYVIICGDWFDHKLFLNEKESYYSYKMIQDLIDVCKKDIKIRFVYGTESHECNQYDIISTITRVDIKVIKYVEEEELFPDLHILYVPEEHILDKKEYYKKYFNNEKKYDYVFGHGIIREGMREAAVKNDNQGSKRKKVPVFSTAELRKICKGQVFFGHYHVNTDLDDVFYVGSFTRWEFGQEEPKGFYEINCDIEKEKYKEKFIENTMAEIFQTISYGYQNPVFQNVDSMEKKLNEIDKLIDTKAFDNIRFQFNIPSDCENPEFIMNYIKERYKFKENIKVNFTHGYIEEKRKHEKEELKKENDKYAFIFDKNMPFENKTAYFINIEYNREIPVERVSCYLYQPLNEILTSEGE